MIFYDPTYLFADGSRHRHGKRPDISPAQVLPLALVAEELQLSLFLVVQAVAVAHLKTNTRSGSTQNQSQRVSSASQRLFVLPHGKKRDSGRGVSKMIYRED